MKKIELKKTVLTAMFIAIGYLLPFLTGQIPQIGKLIAPMHIPVFLCGIICGPLYGLICGIITPIFRSLILTVPVMYPTAVAMAVELGTYGLISGLLTKIFSDKNWFVYPNLIISMITGRITAGIATLILLGINGQKYAFSAFISSKFIGVWLGTIIQLIIIPLIIFALKKAKLIPIK